MNRRSLALMFSLFVSLGALFTPSTASAAESVELYTAFFGLQSRYGCTQYSASFDILTTAFDHQKSVYVHLQESDGMWVDLPASYIETIPGGREVWRASIIYGQGACPTAKPAPDTFELAVKVSTSSGDTWDNNGGENYKAAKASGSLLIGTNIAIAGMSLYIPPEGGRVFSADAFVRNIGYAKNVDVVYSVDGWETVQTAPLGYVNPYVIGYGSYASPNANGIEVWGRPNVTFSSGCIDFAIRYRVNGAEYWENNFGRNFHLCAP
jgi:Carbohydrate/starch-binding module (family 21)